MTSCTVPADRLSSTDTAAPGTCAATSAAAASSPGACRTVVESVGSAFPPLSASNPAVDSASAVVAAAPETPEPLRTLTVTSPGETDGAVLVGAADDGSAGGVSEAKKALTSLSLGGSRTSAPSIRVGVSP